MIAHQLSHKLRKQSLDDMLPQDLQFFDRAENTTGALVSRVDSNPQSFKAMLPGELAYWKQVVKDSGAHID